MSWQFLSELKKESSPQSKSVGQKNANKQRSKATVLQAHVEDPPRLWTAKRRSHATQGSVNTNDTLSSAPINVQLIVVSFLVVVAWASGHCCAWLSLLLEAVAHLSLLLLFSNSVFPEV